MTEPVPTTDRRWTTAELTGGERWFVVHTAPRKELFAADNLARQGFRPFLPRLARTVRHARRTRTVPTALFPRYLFVALDLGRDRWRSLYGTFGVSTVVMDGERPRPVPQGVVEALAEAADAAGVVDYANALQVGDDVRFLKGPFADMVGRLVAMDERGRVGVLLEILGGERVVAATPDALVPATR